MSGLNERCELGPVLCKTRVSEFFEGRSRATGQRIVVQVTPMAADSREALERTLERAVKALTLSRMRGLGEPVDWDVAEDGYWVAFAYAGAPLSSAFDRGFPKSTVVDLAVELAAGLRSLRLAGFVHRSLNPDVIFLMADGKASLLGLEGIRSIGSSDVARSGLAANDPRYTPPEAADYESDDIRSDVYSLGCVLYRLLAGAPPFVGADDNETRQKQRVAPVPPVPGEPSGSAWNAVFAKLLAKRPEDRPQPEDIETLMRPLRYAGMPLGDLVKSEAGFRKPVEQPFPTKTAATIAVAVLVVGGIVLGFTQLGGAGSSVAGTTPSGTPGASARPSGAGSGAPSAPAAASPTASADPATQAPVGTPGPATRPPTPRPTVAPTPPPTPPPTPAPQSVSPAAGSPGTVFHVVFTGLLGGNPYSASYTRGNVTTQYNNGEVPANGVLTFDLKTNAQFPPDTYFFTVRTGGAVRSVTFRIT